MPDNVFLLDTDIVSLFGRPRSPPGLRPWLLELGVDRLAISYPTIAELMRGAHIKRKDDPEKAEQIMAWIRQVLATNFRAPVMTAEVAGVYAQMTSVPSLRNMWTVQRSQKSNRLGHDLMIAAVSIIHQLPILTANISDFMRINDQFPLPGLYHPLEGRWRLVPDREILLPQLDKSLPDHGSFGLPRIDGRQSEFWGVRLATSLRGIRRHIESSHEFACKGFRVRPIGQRSLVYVNRKSGSPELGYDEPLSIQPGSGDTELAHRPLADRNCGAVFPKRLP